MASDPDGIYGERIFELGLAEAVERGVLAPFEIDVLEIEDPDYYVGLSEDAMRGRRLGLLQAALLEHAAKLNLRTVLTFHQQVEEARAFAENLPETAADLYDTEVSEHAFAEADARPASPIRAEADELAAAGVRHVPPDRVWAEWLCGDHPIAHRRPVLDQFANGMDARGRRVHRAFLASVRILGEGVDIVGERGVEAVCIVGARGSMVQVVQNIGRALRPNADGRAPSSTWAAVRSPVSAAVTSTPSSRPSVSTTTCRLRPLTSLPPRCTRRCWPTSTPGSARPATTASSSWTGTVRQRASRHNGRGTIRQLHHAVLRSMRRTVHRCQRRPGAVAVLTR